MDIFILTFNIDKNDDFIFNNLETSINHGTLTCPIIFTMKIFIYLKVFEKKVMNYLLERQTKFNLCILHSYTTYT